jgi:hypothetical protein
MVVKAFADDEGLNLSRSLNIALLAKPGGYPIEEGMIGITQEASGQRSRSWEAAAEEEGFQAALVRKGSTLRLPRCPCTAAADAVSGPARRLGR